MKIEITPNTPEADLRKMITRTYLLQAWACGASATMIMLIYYVPSVLVAVPSVVSVYFGYRMFSSSARARASLHALIKMRRLLP